LVKAVIIATAVTAFADLGDTFDDEGLSHLFILGRMELRTWVEKRASSGRKVKMVNLLKQKRNIKNLEVNDLHSMVRKTA
jgi:hypothetical protein